MPSRAAPSAPRAAERSIEPAATSARVETPLARYQVSLDGSAGALDVRASFARVPGAALDVGRGLGAYVRALSVAHDGGAPRLLDGGDGPFAVPECGDRPCTVRYRFALAEAADALDDVDRASRERSLLEAPPSSFLLAPVAAPGGARLDLDVRTPPGSSFFTGLAPRAQPGRFELTFADLASAPYSAFGSGTRTRLDAGGASAVELVIAEGELAVSHARVERWARERVGALTTFLGDAPHRHALVLVVPARGRWIGPGRSLSGGGASIVVWIGDEAGDAELAADWVLLHELIHLAFPWLASEHAWATEGLATYLEPFVRARASLTSELEAWQGLRDGLDLGQPGEGDRGLDRTHTWARTYWGGALFFFTADVTLRRETSGRCGLEDALRAIVRAGGTSTARWSLRATLRVGDAACHTTTLERLYDAMRARPERVPVGAMLDELGIPRAGARQVLSATAPLAAIRRSIALGPARDAPSP